MFRRRHPLKSQKNITRERHPSALLLFFTAKTAGFGFIRRSLELIPGFRGFPRSLESPDSQGFPGPTFQIWSQIWLFRRRHPLKSQKNITRERHPSALLLFFTAKSAGLALITGGSELIRGFPGFRESVRRAREHFCLHTNQPILDSSGAGLLANFDRKSKRYSRDIPPKVEKNRKSAGRAREHCFLHTKHRGNVIISQNCPKDNLLKSYAL